MSINVAVHLDLDSKAWLRNTISEVSKYTNRTIMIKPKTSEMTLDEALLDCHAIIGYDTNALVDSIIRGTPCFNMGHSAVNSVALQDLCKIESPVYPSRRQWAHNLAYSQWTLDEFRSGVCWDMLNNNE